MRKNQRLNIRLSEEEYSTIKKAAAESGVNMSEYIRLGIGPKRKPLVIPDEFNKLRADLNNAGINLNQLVIRARGENYPADEIKTCLQEIDGIRTELLRVIMNL